jgi:hypothetical protein
LVVKIVLFRVLVLEFYKQNVAFFLSIAFAAVMLFRVSDHFDMARAALHSLPFLTGVYFSTWLLYTVKTSLFVLKSLSNPKQSFLYNLRLFPLNVQFQELLSVQLYLMAPVFFYAGFMVFLGFMDQTWISIALILGFILLVFLVPVLVFIRDLKHPNAQQSNWSLSSAIHVNFISPYPVFFIRFLLRHQKMLLIQSKLLSCFLVWGVCILYPTDQYDFRLISIGMLLAAVGNSMITNQYHHFEKEHLLIFRNLPFSDANRFKLQTFTYAIFLVPELVILLRNLPQEIDFILAFQAWFFLLSVVLSFHFFHYFQPAKPEESSKIYFVVFFSNMLLIMYRVPILLPTAALIVCSFFLLKKYYSKVEYEIGIN